MFCPGSTKRFIDFESLKSSLATTNRLSIVRGSDVLRQPAALVAA